MLWAGLAPPGMQGRDAALPRAEDVETPRDPDATTDPVLVREVEPIPIELPSGGGAAPAGVAIDSSVGLRVPAHLVARTGTGREELLERRSERSRTFAEDDGTFTTEISPSRLNYQDADGAWVPLDLRLRTVDGAGPYDLEVSSHDRMVRFSTADADAAMAEVASALGRIAIRAVGYGAAAERGDDDRVSFAAEADRPVVWAMPADYGLEFGATLAGPQQSGVVGFVLDAGQLSVALAEDGRTLLLMAEEATEDGRPSVPREVGFISAPLVFDATYAPPPPDAIRVELFAPGDGVMPGDLPAVKLAKTETLVVYRIDPAWLAAAEREYPVTLDPTICLGHQASGCNHNQTTGGGDHFVASLTQPSGWTVNRTGYDARSDDGGSFGAMRSLWYFPDVSAGAWPDGAHVQAATLRLQIGFVAGSPGGKVINAYGINTGWSGTSTWAQVANAYNTTPTHSLTIPASPGVGTNLSFNVTDIVRTWYMRRGVDWRPNAGILLKFASEPSNAGELDFRRWGSTTTGTASPLLTITYSITAVDFAFDPALGPDYAPSTMIAGQTATLPVVVSNTGPASNPAYSDFNSNYHVGYRWFDADGALVGAATTGLGGTVVRGSSSGIIPLDVTPPSAVGQYTLRLDLIRVPDTDVWVSDWATPSLYYSRDKRSPSPDHTRWSGLSVVERAEFPISVVSGAGTTVGTIRSVPTGAGGALGINLWSGNLRYTGDAGVGFDDLIPLGVGYGYDRDQVGDCDGLLAACGWWTNWDEGFTVGSAAGQFAYQAVDGTQHLVSTDPDGQLVSGAPLLLQRQRYTLYDENAPENGAVTLVTASSAGLTAPSGTYVQRSNSAVPSSYGLTAARGIEITNYRMARFYVRTTAAAGTGIDFTIRNLSNPGTYPDLRLVYTVGTDFTVGFAKKALGGTVLNTWGSFATDIYQDAIAVGAGQTGDRLMVVAMQTTSNGQGGFTYTDAVRFTGLEGTFIDDANPGWSAGGSTTSSDAAHGTYSVRIDATATHTSAPRCDRGASSCFATSGNFHTYHFMNWYWKKVGGQTAALVLKLTDLRTSAVGTMTYYAGPVPPAGAEHPVQVSDVAPENWTLVTRNVYRDAQQALGFYNDDPAGTGSASPPSQGPIGDRVRLESFWPWAPDGAFVLFDRFQYGSLPERGSTTAVYEDDFLVTAGGGQTSFFNRDGLLERVRDRDGNAVTLDYTLDPDTDGPAAYTLTAIRAATDGTSGAGSTYRRYLEVAHGTVTGYRQVTFTERLGSAAAPINGRSAQFFVSTTTSSASAPGNTHPTAALVYLSPGRHPGSSCTGSRPTGCVEFDYTNTVNHSIDEVRDPRWSGATSGSDDLRLTVAYSGINPVSITDRSATGQPQLLSVGSYDRGSNASYRVAVWQDADMRAANQAGQLQLSPDGAVMVEYQPKACSGTCSPSVLPTAPVVGDRMVVNQFNGLSRVSQTTHFRTLNANPTVTRQGTYAAAKVDNLADPLTANQVAWTQSADQHFASLRDSGGTDPDLYRTTYTYNEWGRPTSSSTPSLNARPAYAPTVLSTTQTASDLKGYWRLGETAGTTATDLAPSPNHGTIAGGTTLNQTGALVGDTNPAMLFNGTTGRVTAAKALPQGAYTLSAWVNQQTAYTAGGHGIAGRWNANSGVLLYVYNGTLSLVHANQYVHTGIKLEANRWYLVAATWDGATARVYIDGQLVAQQALAAAPGTGASSFEIASYRNGASSTFNHAAIDEVALWSRALTSIQVAALHQAGRSVARPATRTTYDLEWHPAQVASQHLASPGFESGAADWDFGWGSGGSVFVATTPGHVDVHSGFASFKTGPNGNVQQDVQLVPGQTFRFQVFEKRTGTARAAISLYAWNRDTAVWDTLVNVGYENAGWTGHAWDVTVPQASDGRIRVALWTQNGGAGHTVMYDDAAIITDYASFTYNANGTLNQAFTFHPATTGGLAPAEIEMRSTYLATGMHPAIFPVSVVANYANGTFDPAIPDQDVTSFATYDAWGRLLTATDPDGVTRTTTYASSGNGIHTDVASTADGLGHTTIFTYDVVGNPLTTTSPGGLISARTVDHFGRPLDETGPDGIVTRHAHDPYGRETATITNYRDGTANNDGSGIDDVTTVRTFDVFGRTIRTDADDGGIDQVTTTTYDLLGNVTAQTSYADGGTAGPRTTTHHFETVTAGSTTYSRTAPTGVRLASQPSAAPAPICPGASSPTRCNSVSLLDLNGRVVRSTDAWGKAAVTWRDLAGQPVFAWANYVDGVFSAGVPDSDLLTATQYDIGGRVRAVTDVAGRITTTTIDALARPVRTTRHDGSFASVVYTPGGRIERASRLAASGTSDANLSWTRTEYDAAGRAVRTLDHYDIDGDAHYLLDGLETGTDGWSGSALSGFLSAAASIDLDTAYHAVGPATGAGRLRVVTSAGGANSGASRDLSGRTFIAGRTYRLQATVLAPNGTGLRALLGVAGGSPASAALTANGAWQTISVDWIPSSTTAADVYGAIRKDAAGAVDVYIDDLQVWDVSDAAWNIPTQTAYDADGRIVASVLPPGTPGEAPMVTTTAYDPAGRVVAVSANARSTYAARIAAGAMAEDLVAYWPLDAASGTSLATALGSGPALTRAGGSRLGVAGAVDEARTGLAVDAGWAAASAAASTATDNFSLEAWFRLDTAGANQTIAYNGTDAGGWGLGLDGSGQLAAVYGGVATLSTNQTPSLGAWHHAVLVRDGGTATIYLDGTAHTPSSSGSAPLAPGAGFSLGRQSASTPRYLDGAVDEVAVYGTALSAGVVGAHYAAGREPATDARLTTRTDYDALGRASAATDPRGIVTAHEVDRLGRTTATVANWRDGSAASASSDDDVRSTFAHNALGELIGVCTAVQVFVGGCDPADPAEIQAWRYTYDLLGNRATQVPPLNTTLTPLDTRVWTYDPGGRLTSTVDRSGAGTVSRHTDYGYDGVGRILTERTYLGGGTSNLELEFTTTWNPDGTRASRAFDGTAASPAQGSDTLSFTYDALGRPDQVKRSSTVLTDAAWNADDTLASRLDDGVGTTAFTYDWAGRQAGLSAPALFGSGSVSLTYRLDGTLASRSTPNGVTAAVSYDAARRPTGIDLGASSLSRGYDRAGNVVSDGRSFAGVSGDAGTGTAAYNYDGLNRVSASNGLSRTDSYTYDRDGNRLSAVEGATTVAYTYDRADQAIQQTISGVDTAFAYNAWGDLTSAADRDNGVTTHAYDAGGRLVSLTPPGATPATYTYDALGRPATRSIASASLTYAYIGTTPRSYATIPNAGSATYALIDADASRLALDTGGTTAWSLFDLHGDLAAATAAAGATIVSALRSDAYGASLDTYTAGSGATAVPWRYQDRLDLSPDPDEPLYDYGARRYRPNLGAFTALDTYPGSALNPLSLNRYLYAHANPTSLIDPSGHCVVSVCADGVPIPTRGANHAVQMAAAQAQIADAASWAPASASDPGSIALEMTAAANQARADATQLREIQRAWRLAAVAPTVWVYQPNPSNLPWVGQPVGDLTRQERLGRVLAAAAAAPPCGPSGCISPTTFASVSLQMIPLLGDAYQFGIISAGYDPIAGQSFTEQERQGAAVLFFGSIGIVPAQVARAPRAAQDVAVDGLPAPPVLSTARTISRSESQNAVLQADVAALRRLNAEDIRINQTQVDAAGQRVGINRPDLQYTLDGVRYYVEYEVPTSTRGPAHVARLLANDPWGFASYRIVP